MTNKSKIAKRSRTRARLLLLTALGVSFSTAAQAQNVNVIDTDTVHDTGTFRISTDNTTKLAISGESNPELTLKNGTSTAGVALNGSVRGLVAGMDGNSGQLTIKEGSTFNNNGVGDIWNHVDGQVLRGQSYLGLSSGSTGVITVTGAGSIFTHANDQGVMGTANHLNIGYRGTGLLNVIDGATASNTDGIIGVNAGSVGQAVVSGINSLWTNTRSLFVGSQGTGTLSVTDGGMVTNVNGTIGSTAGSTGVATVSGAGSTWTNNGTLIVGSVGSGTLNIGAGAEVTNVGNGTIGSSAGSTGTATVSGGTWNNASLTIGQSGTGTLTVDAGGTVVNSGSTTVGSAANSNGELSVTGAGSSLTSAGQTVIGSQGTGKLTIADGGVVNSNSTTGFTILGNTAAANGEAMIAGAGSTWNIANDLLVGGTSTPNTGKLTVDNGGAVNTRSLLGSASNLHGNGTISTKGTVLDGAEVVFNAASGANTSVAIDQGPTISIHADGTGQLGAGYRGIGTLTVSDGVVVQSSQGHLGYRAGADGTATVTGTGSAWNNDGVLNVGNAGAGTLNITAGGSVSNTIGYIGNSAGSSGEVLVDGAGSTWNNSQELFVGNNGMGKLTVQNGATVNARSLIAAASDLHGDGTIVAKGGVFDANLQFDATSGTNKTLAFGSGGEVQVNVDGTGFLGVGHKGIGSLTITEGVTIESSRGIVGNLAGSEGTATVSGSGTAWNNTGALTIGEFGKGSLTITDGATVSNTTGNLGARSGSDGEALISGTGSAWNNSGVLTIAGGVGGTVTPVGKLTVEAGGSVTSTDGRVGGSSGAGEALITGANSRWENSGTLTVGASGTSAKLTIADGAHVVSANANVSAGNGAAHAIGEVLVTGAGSTWTNNDRLSVGEAKTGSLTIADGATVTSTTGFIARGLGSASNPNISNVVVTGAGSALTMTGSLVLGGQTETAQSGNTFGVLTVKDGGTVAVGGSLVTHASDRVQLQSGGTIKANNYQISRNGALGVLDWTGGTLDITDTLQVGPTSGYLLEIPELGLLTGGGRVVGNANSFGITADASVVNAGVLAPGNSPGTFSIFGDYTQLASGTLDIELGGLLAGVEYDQLLVSGNAFLNGTLSVSLFDDFTLSEGDSFNILTANQINDTFAGLADGATVGRFGDYNLIVSYSDTAVSLSATAVPEPSAIAVLAIGTIGLARRYQRRKRHGNETGEPSQS